MNEKINKNEISKMFLKEEEKKELEVIKLQLFYSFCINDISKS